MAGNLETLVAVVHSDTNTLPIGYISIYNKFMSEELYTFDTGVRVKHMVADYTRGRLIINHMDESISIWEVTPLGATLKAKTEAHVASIRQTEQNTCVSELTGDVYFSGYKTTSTFLIGRISQTTIDIGGAITPDSLTDYNMNHMDGGNPVAPMPNTNVQVYPFHNITINPITDDVYVSVNGYTDNGTGITYPNYLAIKFNSDLSSFEPVHDLRYSQYNISHSNELSSSNRESNHNQNIFHFNPFTNRLIISADVPNPRLITYNVDSNNYDLIVPQEYADRDVNGDTLWSSVNYTGHRIGRKSGRIHYLGKNERIIINPDKTVHGYFEYLGGTQTYHNGFNELTEDHYIPNTDGKQILMFDYNNNVVASSPVFGDSVISGEVNKIEVLPGINEKPPVGANRNQMVYPIANVPFADTTPEFVFRLGVSPTGWKLGYRFVATKDESKVRNGNVQAFNTATSILVSVHTNDSQEVTVDPTTDVGTGTLTNISNRVNVGETMTTNLGVFTVASIVGNDISFTETVTGTFTGNLVLNNADDIIMDTFVSDDGYYKSFAQADWKYSDDYNESNQNPQDPLSNWNTFVVSGVAPKQDGSGEGVIVDLSYQKYLRFTLPNDLELSGAVTGDTWYFGLFSYSESV
jgi:hypothetical protein